MSAAFRNFILTLIIMLVALGYIAYKAVPDIENELFGETEESGENDTSYTDESGDVSGDVSEDVSGDENQYVTHDFVFAAKNSEGKVVSMIYIRISTENNLFFTCRIPVDSYLYDGTLPTKLSDLIGKNNNEYLIKKMSALIGHDIEYYIVLTPLSFATVADVATENGTPLYADLTYEVKYLDPDFEPLITDVDNIPEEFYRVMPVGRNELSSENIAEVINSISPTASGSTAGDASSYNFQESAVASIMQQFFSQSRIASDKSSLDRIYAVITTNILPGDITEIAEYLFAYGEMNRKTLTYPTTKNTLSSYGEIKLPDWQEGIRQITEKTE